MIIDSEKSKFLHILEICKERRVKNYTQNEVCEFLELSRKKLSNFENGKIFDFWLLCRYADLNYYKIEFKIIL